VAASMPLLVPCTHKISVRIAGTDFWLRLDAAGLEVGILAGLIASTFYFAFTYARVGLMA
jgi:hypothetical protein